MKVFIKLNPILGTLIVSIAVILSACGNMDTTPSPLLPSPNSSVAPSPAIQLKPESLEEILARAALISQVSYDMTSKGSDGLIMAGKVWIKGKQVKIETSLEGSAMLMIFDLDKLQQYMCLTSKKIATQSKYDSSNDEAEMFPDKMASYILKSKPQMIGSETYDGKDCAIIEYDNKDGKRSKAWIWKARGFSLKMVVPSPQGEIITEVKNISFQDIQDSLFKLPADVRLVSQVEMNAAMSGSPAPTSTKQYFPNQYKNSEWGYSIQYPDGWKVDISDPVIVMITSSEAWVLISGLKAANLTLDAWVKMNQEYFTEKGIQYRVLTEEIKTLSDGTPFVALATKSGPNNSSASTQDLKMFAVANGFAFSVTASTTDNAWEKNGETLGRMLDSVRFN